MEEPLDHYYRRMQRVLDHIDLHLDGDLDLETLSSVAAFSKFHFHRQFKATFGVSLHRYVQLARMRRASQWLFDSQSESVTEIALNVGYTTPDAFARTFRQRFGQSPSSFRRSPKLQPWFEELRPFYSARSKIMQSTFTSDQVTIRYVAPVRVAIFEHRGDPEAIDTTVQRFIAWRKAAGLSPQTSATFNIWHSERRPANPADYSMDLCVEVGADQAIELADEKVKMGNIPGGRCAVLRVTGETHNLEPAALYLYRDWLPASGEEMRNFPIYCQRFFLARRGLDTAADLFLPLATPSRSAGFFVRE